MAVQMLYFAWVRERMGTSEERVVPPAMVTTVAALIDWLATIDEAHAHALEDRTRLRAAVDQHFGGLETSIIGAREIALFPPVTGG